MSNRRGFTLIELLIVVVIIGILAAIAIPKFANSKEKAYLAAMKSDLRNLMTAQENYHADWITYTTNTAVLNMAVSSGVNITITGATSTGWQATATHNAVPTSKSCGIFYGSGTAPITGQSEGEPKCN